MNRCRCRPGTVIATLLLVFAPVPSASATFPGANGPIVVSLPGTGACHMRGGYLGRTPWDRLQISPITPRCEAHPAPWDERDVEPRRTYVPEFAPDGERLLAMQSGGIPPGIVTLRADGRELRSVPVQGSGPSFSPDGERFAYVHQDAIWTARLDGTEARRILGSQPRCRSSCIRAFSPRWSPDGRYIAAVVEAAPVVGSSFRPSIRPGIWLVRPDDGRLVRRVMKFGYAIDWSPDSRWLVLQTTYRQRANEGGASGGNLYVVRRDGRRRRRIVHRHGTAETSPRWSPDGRWVAWISLDFSGGDVSFRVMPSLWRVRVHDGRESGTGITLGKLPEPYVEEGYWDRPLMTWGPRPPGSSSHQPHPEPSG